MAPFSSLPRYNGQANGSGGGGEPGAVEWDESAAGSVDWEQEAVADVDEAPRGGGRGRRAGRAGGRK